MWLRVRWESHEEASGWFWSCGGGGIEGRQCRGWGLLPWAVEHHEDGRQQFRIDHRMQGGDKPGKVGWGQIVEGLRCQVELFAFYSVSNEDGYGGSL